MITKRRSFRRYEWGFARTGRHGWKEWVMHRDDGPAVEWDTGEKEWYAHGRFLGWCGFGGAIFKTQAGRDAACNIP